MLFRRLIFDLIQLRRGASLSVMAPGVLVGMTATPCGIATAAASEDLPRLVRQLGSDAFSQRQAAHQRILDRGPDALPFLEEVDGNSDAEVELRVERLVDRLRDIRNEALLADLMATPLRPAPPGLPAWERYVHITGDRAKARILYRDMLRSNAGLLEELEQGAAGAAVQELVDIGVGRFRLGRSATSRKVTREEMGLLLLSAVEPESTGNRAVGLLLQQLLNQTHIERTPPDDPTTEEDPLRRLLAAWVMSPHAGSRSDRMSVGLSHSLTETVEPAREVLLELSSRSRKVGAGYDDEDGSVFRPVHLHVNLREVQDAVLTLARFGGVEHIPDLEPLLRNATSLSQLRRRRTTELESRVQDLALLALLHITDQAPVADYRFHKGLQKHARSVYSAQTVGFENDDTRQAALRKWRYWRAIHLRSPLFGPLDAIEGVTL